MSSKKSQTTKRKPQLLSCPFEELSLALNDYIGFEDDHPSKAKALKWVQRSMPAVQKLLEKPAAPKSVLSSKKKKTDQQEDGRVSAKRKVTIAEPKKKKSTTRKSMK